MKKLYLALFIIAILFLTACQSSQQIKPIREEIIDFDLNTAIEMVQKREELIISLIELEQLSHAEYQQLEIAFAEQFGDRGRDILTIFFINDMDAEPESDKLVNKNTLYPTIFHEGITVTKAEIFNTYYEEEFFNRTSLTITVEYTGEDEKLKDWSKEYIFTPNKDGEWELSGFSGSLNFMGDDFNMNYLELKK